MNYAKWDRTGDLDFEELEPGETLVKFVARGDIPKEENGSTNLDNPWKVEIHGFVKKDGTLLYTHEFCLPPKRDE